MQKQNYYVHGWELPFKTKKKVKLICSWAETAIQNRKCKINMFMAGNCRSKQKM